MRIVHCVAGVPLVVLVLAAPLRAQSAPPGFLEEFEGQFEASSTKLVALAEAMPEESYEWRPMQGVASVASVYMHIARYNYMYPDQNLGIPAPMGRGEYARWEDEVADKATVVEILSESMAHVRSVAARVGEEGLDDPTRLYGREVGRWAVLFQLLAHMNEHLGQSIAYARMNGVVPPWSR